MFYTLKSLLRTLVLPPSGPLILAIIGLWLLWRHRRTGITLMVVGLGSLWLLCTPLVADVLTRATERFPALDLSKPVQADAVVILAGGGIRESAPEFGGGPAPERELLERLAYGAYVARKTSLPVLVTGTPEEVAAMRNSLVRDFGVSVRWLEVRSRDTFDNARYSAQMLFADHVKRIVLVTSATHLWRSTQEFRSAGFDVIPAPVGILSPRERPVFLFLPSSQGLMRSEAALYELWGERVRELLAALHLRRQSVATPP
jgi:uncharacterized SAM-binding protein YcdF (DUF218 family)